MGEVVLDVSAVLAFINEEVGAKSVELKALNSISVMLLSVRLTYQR